ncbi:hypothetical protein QW060_13855 [Myroides ceti]|uniref:Uncharacterized protein n=1 Tax=Paenimyroides ceti TaxID=395087 RepID=A0ABT8CVN2_9FLAO|nr:hypothetical protein [Paenimyroides ceti]MDN3708191.1 hypothetical protein [Paenimyroides ceti]
MVTLLKIRHRCGCPDLIRDWHITPLKNRALFGLGSTVKLPYCSVYTSRINIAMRLSSQF